MNMLKHQYVPDRWQPDAWRLQGAHPMFRYPEAQIDSVSEQLRGRPGLVEFAKVQGLLSHLAEAARGKAFVLKMGPREEHFEDANREDVDARLCILESIRKYLTFMQALPVVAIGTLAGNYARSCDSPTEAVGERVLPSYFGDMVNLASPHLWGRQPDANRLLWAYEAASATLEWIKHHRHPVYTGHECVNLHFEEALTRPCPDGGGFFSASAHLLSVLGASLVPDGPNLAFLGGLANPIAVSVGPDMKASMLKEICRALNPSEQAGKLILVSSMGRQMAALSELLCVVRDEGAQVLWLCDPSRENYVKKAGSDALDMKAIVDEVEATVAMHASHQSYLGGLDLAALPTAGSSLTRSVNLDFKQALQICSHWAHAIPRFK